MFTATLLQDSEMFNARILTVDRPLKDYLFPSTATSSYAGIQPEWLKDA